MIDWGDIPKKARIMWETMKKQEERSWCCCICSETIPEHSMSLVFGEAEFRFNIEWVCHGCLELLENQMIEDHGRELAYDEFCKECWFEFGDDKRHNHNVDDPCPLDIDPETFVMNMSPTSKR